MGPSLKTVVALVVMAIVALPGASWALSLDQARGQGLVGETPRGYVAPVQSPTPEVAELVRQVNAARRADYERVAEQTGATVEQVGILMAEKIRAQLPSGAYLQTTDGRWVQK